LDLEKNPISEKCTKQISEIMEQISQLTFIRKNIVGGKGECRII
jgi:hypothetical protein